MISNILFGIVFIEIAAMFYAYIMDTKWFSKEWFLMMARINAVIGAVLFFLIGFSILSINILSGILE